MSLGSGIGIGLEYGHIGKCSMKVPWTQLQSGEVEVVVDDVELVLRLHFDDSELCRKYLEPDHTKMVYKNILIILMIISILFKIYIIIINYI